MLPKNEFDEIIANTEAVKRWVLIGVGVVLLLVAFAAFGESYQFRDQQGNTVVLTDKDCPVSFLKGWKRAEFRYQGKNYEACWRNFSGTVLVVDSEGDATPLPVQAFTKMDGV